MVTLCMVFDKDIKFIMYLTCTTILSGNLHIFILEINRKSVQLEICVKSHNYQILDLNLEPL